MTRRRPVVGVDSRHGQTLVLGPGAPHSLKFQRILDHCLDSPRFDSQGDNQLREPRHTLTDVSARWTRPFDLGRTSAHRSGCEKHGLQNRLRGAVEASWVGSIPIHPRQFRRR